MFTSEKVKDFNRGVRIYEEKQEDTVKLMIVFILHLKNKILIHN